MNFVVDYEGWLWSRAHLNWMQRNEPVARMARLSLTASLGVNRLIWFWDENTETGAGQS